MRVFQPIRAKMHPASSSFSSSSSLRRGSASRFERAELLRKAVLGERPASVFVRRFIEMGSQEGVFSLEPAFECFACMRLCRGNPDSNLHKVLRTVVFSRVLK